MAIEFSNLPQNTEACGQKPKTLSSECGFACRFLSRFRLLFTPGKSRDEHINKKGCGRTFGKKRGVLLFDAELENVQQVMATTNVAVIGRSVLLSILAENPSKHV
jgi:hypothetical protein